MPHATLIDIFDAVARRPRPDLLRYRQEGEWRCLSTEEFVARVRSLAAFLIDFGVAPGDRIALLSENRPEWTISDFAIHLAGATGVPLFPSLSAEQTAWMLRHCGATIVLVSRRELLRKLAPAAGGPGAGPRIVLFDGGAGDPAHGFEVASLAEACEHGGRRLLERPGLVEERMRSVAPGDVASIIYTSGTTGDPKGVMLSHGNFASNVDACLAILPFSTSDLTISLLPLSHVLERTVEYCYLAGGASIAFAESVEKALPVIREIRPTVFTAVPRVLEKLHSRVLDGVKSSSPSRRRLFAWALASGREKLALGLARRPVPLLLEWKCRLADRLVFSRIRERLGGRVRFMLSGGAPLPREITEFFLAMGITVFEGYGMTETAPVISVNTFGRLRPGTVGQPIPGVEVRIAGDGEILVRGPNVMKGYYGDPEGTRAVLRGGFLATGDIGHFDGEGFLSITDRKKDLLITSAGKNVAPQPIENAIRLSRYIANVILFGDRKKYLTALVVPDFEALGPLAASLGLGGEPPAALASRPEIRALIETEIAAATAGFSEHERVRRFALLERDFDQDHGEVTPTLKLRRRVVAEHFRTVIEAMYGSS